MLGGTIAGRSKSPYKYGPLYSVAGFSISSYLERSFSGTLNWYDNNLWTLSFWLKNTLPPSYLPGGATPDFQHIADCGGEPTGTKAEFRVLLQGEASNLDEFRTVIRDSDNINVLTANSDPYIFNDAANWIHVVIRFSAEKDSPDTFRIEVNGVSVPLDYPVSSSAPYPQVYLSNIPHQIGIVNDKSKDANKLKGLLSEVICCSGQNYSAINFGEERNGVWVPKRFNQVNAITQGIGTAYASDYFPGDPPPTGATPPEYALDGNIFDNQRCWATDFHFSPTDIVWWAWDTGSPRLFVRMFLRNRLTSNTARQRFLNFVIQGSNNSTNGSDGDWADISQTGLDMPDTPNANTAYELDPQGVKYQWLRVIGNPASVGSGNYFAAILEAQVIENTGQPYYGPRGFHLNFADPLDLGKDISGNGNHFTTFGTGLQQRLDSPTYNLPTLNIYKEDLESVVEIKESGTLLAQIDSPAATAWTFAAATLPIPDTGRWYFEGTNLVSGHISCGICITEGSRTGTWNAWAQNRNTILYQSLGGVYVGTTQVRVDTPSAAWEVPGEWGGIGVDMDAKQIYLYTEGDGDTPNYTLDISSWDLSEGLFFQVGAYYDHTGPTRSELLANFGQTSFSHLPTGFQAMANVNMRDPMIIESDRGRWNFDYIGNGVSPRDFRGAKFFADEKTLVWIKDLTSAQWHTAFDTERPNGVLFFNDGFVEVVNHSQGYVDQYYRDGFRAVEGGTGFDDLNKSGDNYWNLTLKADPRFGFDIVTYNGAGGNQTIPHGLGRPPEMIWVKRRNTSTTDWVVYNQYMGVTDYVLLNNVANGRTTPSPWWQTPDANNFYVADWTQTGASGGQYVAYLFASIPGFMKLGIYTGNALVGYQAPWLDINFRTGLFIVRNISDTNKPWTVFSDVLNPWNLPVPSVFQINVPDVPLTPTSDHLNLYSNGVKITNSGTWVNASGREHIYLAIAEQGLKYLNGR